VDIEFGKWDMPKVHPRSFQSTNPKIFFGGDAAFGPKNVITAVAHGHQAAISIDLFLTGKDVRIRPEPGTNLVSQKMGIHEWSYDSNVVDDVRYAVPHADVGTSIKDRKLEVELGFDLETGFAEAQRCLNCDAQTVFSEKKCIECDACVDVCPTDCITFTAPAEEAELRNKLSAPANNLEQSLYVSDDSLPTGRVMVKDENVCLHCGLCAERCPTAAWDIQKFTYEVTKAGQGAGQ
jgi:ferredoxin